MPEYKGPRMSKDEMMERCECWLSRAYHEPDEAYYGEHRLEGKRSSSPALRDNGCQGYRPRMVRLGDLMRRRFGR